MMMSLQSASDAMNGRLLGSVDGEFSSVQFDSRKVTNNDLFFAIRGLAQDGHQYIDSAIKNGASAVVMDALGARQNERQSQKQKRTSPQNAIVVEDTTAALGDLARSWRKRFTVPVVGITGSNGKTTVSNILSEIFSVAIPGIAPEGSFNNHWGVPMTLLKLRETDQSAVIEMGMNHSGELSYLGAIVKPTIGVITNAAAAHLEGLKTVEGVAKAKGELIQTISENGWVVLNRDDAFYELWRGLVGNRKVVTFGQNDLADVQLSSSVKNQFIITFKESSITMSCELLGEHNHLNVAAASAAALCAGMDLMDIKLGVSAVKAVNGRLQLKQSNKVSCLIDDTYNANPASMRAAIDVLANYEESTLVLGTMGELGENATDAHFEVGLYAKQRGITSLWVFCDNAANEQLAHKYAQGFGVAAEVFTDLQVFSDYLQTALVNKKMANKRAVLIKGSRAAQMERLVKLLQQEDGAC